MSPSITMTSSTTDEKKIKKKKERVNQSQMLFQKGVQHLLESGLSKVPEKFIWPLSERPNLNNNNNYSTNILKEPISTISMYNNNNLKLPIIDFADLQGPNRAQVLESLANACEHYGFFQVVNHGISSDVISNMIDVSKRFFELPFDERSKYMTSDMRAPVRYGTSFNQNIDKVFCWRDFLKLMCHPLSDVLPHWPSSPIDLRKLAATYAKETNYLFLLVMEALLESLGVMGTTENNKKEEEEEEEEETMKKFEDGSQLMVVNCYPPCPEPDLTLGMPPHSDYGFLTMLLQDETEGLQIQYQHNWVTVEPRPNSFVVNVGDHLEIFSNGKYRSVLHRVLVNSKKARISVASLHSFPFLCTVSPSPKLINESNPRRYKDTDFDSFLKYISSREPKRKNFLDSRKLS